MPPADTRPLIRGPVGDFQKEAQAFLSRINDAKSNYLIPNRELRECLQPNGGMPNGELKKYLLPNGEIIMCRLFYAQTLGEARKLTIDAAGGVEEVNAIKLQEWGITQLAWQSQHDAEAKAIRKELDEFGKKAWDAASKGVYARIGTKNMSKFMDISYDAAQDAAMAIRLKLLNGLGFENKASLIRGYNTTNYLWCGGYCVAVCKDDTIFAYTGGLPE